MKQPEPAKATPLNAQVEQLLTEARVIIPGAQALLGFQFAVTLTRAFEQLPPGAKLAHTIALLCVALAVILLMAPAHCIGSPSEARTRRDDRLSVCHRRAGPAVARHRARHRCGRTA